MFNIRICSNRGNPRRPMLMIMEKTLNTLDSAESSESSPFHKVKRGKYYVFKAVLSFKDIGTLNHQIFYKGWLHSFLYPWVSTGSHLAGTMNEH